MLWKLTDIKWDTSDEYFEVEDEDLDLPEVLIAEAADEEEAVDVATDKVGFCIKGCCFNQLQGFPRVIKDWESFHAVLSNILTNSDNILYSDDIGVVAKYCLMACEIALLADNESEELELIFDDTEFESATLSEDGLSFTVTLNKDGEAQDTRLSLFVKQPFNLG